MKKEDLYKEIGFVDPDIIEEAANIPKKSFSRHQVGRLGFVAASLAILVAVAVPVLKIHPKGPGAKVTITKSPEATKDPSTTMESFPDLTTLTGGIKAKYIKEVPEISTVTDHAELSLQEIFNEMDTIIFTGTVLKIKNIELDFKEITEYRALARIKVSKVYRGEIKQGDSILVLLPCGIRSKAWVEDTGVISQLREGMTGIFMPLRYDANSYGEINGVRFTYKEVADYGLSDGERFAFLQTEKGLAFCDWTYEELQKRASLDEVEQYIKKMIQ